MYYRTLVPSQPPHRPPNPLRTRRRMRRHRCRHHSSSTAAAASHHPPPGSRRDRPARRARQALVECRRVPCRKARLR
eukprot:scaffold10173_cov119-Isochrysis_galbana.AAC.9